MDNSDKNPPTLCELIRQKEKLLLEKKFIENQIRAMYEQLKTLQVEYMHLAKSQDPSGDKVLNDPISIKKKVNPLIPSFLNEEKGNNFDNMEEINTKPIVLGHGELLNQMVLGKYVHESEEEDEND